MPNITEKVFREPNNLCDPYPFGYTAGNTKAKPTFNPSYYAYIISKILKMLSQNDTGHDLLKPRGDYKPKDIFSTKAYNYLMTGNYFPLENTSDYMYGLNFPEFRTSKGSSFENKVARSIELNADLQPAIVRITYRDVFEGMDTTLWPPLLISQDLFQKVKDSNGSISIVTGLGDTADDAEEDDEEETAASPKSFEFYFSTLTEPQQTDLQIKVTYFIKWFMFSEQLNDMPERFPPEAEGLPMDFDMNSRVLISADAGFSFLKTIFEWRGSKIVPLINVPTILDSASTSISEFDESEEDSIVFENLEQGTVYPLFANYFTSEKIIMCYVLNDNCEFAIDNMYCFSLCILNVEKFPQETDTDTDTGMTLKQAYDNIRTVDRSEPLYNNSCRVIYNFIIRHPQLVVRYYFGEPEKTNRPTDKCGKCGAGVPYIGKVFKTIDNAKQLLMRDPRTNAGTIKDVFDNLKGINGRIPFADARIFNLFKIDSENNGFVQSATDEDLNYLFKILADYKRTGDYGQMYAVLNALLDGKYGTSCKIFLTVDELAALISRLCAVPTMQQTPGTGKITLYRNIDHTINSDPAAILAYNVKQIEKMRNAFISECTTKREFVVEKIDAQKEVLINLTEQLITFLNTPPVGAGLGLDFFDILSLCNAIAILNHILFTISLLDNFDEQLGRLSTIDNMEQLKLQIQEIKDTELYSLADFVSKYFPRLLQEEPVTPFTQDQLEAGNFVMPSLLAFKSRHCTGIDRNLRSNFDLMRRRAKEYIDRFKTGGRVRAGKILPETERALTIIKFNNFLGTLWVMQFVDRPIAIDSESFEVLSEQFGVLTYSAEFISERVQKDFREIRQGVGVGGDRASLGGGKKLKNGKILQKGGAIIEENEDEKHNSENNTKFVQHIIADYLKKCEIKCNNFMNDVLNNSGGNEGNEENIIADAVLGNKPLDLILTLIILNYDVVKFCNELLYGINGLMTMATELAYKFKTDFTLDDTFGADLEERDIVSRLTSINDNCFEVLFTMDEMLGTNDVISIVNIYEIYQKSRLKKTNTKSQSNEANISQKFLSQYSLPLNSTASSSKGGGASPTIWPGKGGMTGDGTGEETSKDNKPDVSTSKTDSIPKSDMVEAKVEESKVEEEAKLVEEIDEVNSINKQRTKYLENFKKNFKTDKTDRRYLIDNIKLNLQKSAAVSATPQDSQKTEAESLGSQMETGGTFFSPDSERSQYYSVDSESPIREKLDFYSVDNSPTKNYEIPEELSEEDISPEELSEEDISPEDLNLVFRPVKLSEKQLALIDTHDNQPQLSAEQLASTNSIERRQTIGGGFGGGFGGFGGFGGDGNEELHKKVAEAVRLINEINQGRAANNEAIHNKVQNLMDAYNNIKLTPEQEDNYQIMGIYLTQKFMGGSIKNSKKRQSRTHKKRIIKKPKKTYKKNKHFSQHKTRKINK